MLWFAVHLPWLSLEAWAATLPAEQRRRPLALLAERPAASRVSIWSAAPSRVKSAVVFTSPPAVWAIFFKSASAGPEGRFQPLAEGALAQLCDINISVC